MKVKKRFGAKVGRAKWRVIISDCDGLSEGRFFRLIEGAYFKVILSFINRSIKKINAI
jgi:hypothetical protein